MEAGHWKALEYILNHGGPQEWTGGGERGRGEVYGGE